MNTQRTQYQLFLSFEKEEAWLEAQSRQGWHLVNVSSGLKYVFEQSQPEERVYKIDFRFFDRQEEMDEYVSLFEDSGWRCVSPKKSSYNYYFYTTRKEGAQTDIFSDQASRAQRYLRYAQYSMLSFIPFLPIYMALYANGAIKIQELGYLTPGLWQMQGVQFWRHFLFETPFVVLRVAGGLLPLIIVLLFTFFSLRYYFHHRKLLRQQG
ncbi:MAG: DUF2812 domain-containing protein [Chloroflexi bacterium]|nr:DUF2812 domain-containing protein [Chloroflexota bacterium]